MAIAPMEQFLVHPVVHIQPIMIGSFPLDLSITNSTVSMIVAALVAMGFLALAGKRELVPGRMQATGEALFGLVNNVLVEPIIGHKGKPYVPFIFTIFMLVLVMNLMGVVLAVAALAGFPGATFTPTAQLAITATLALITFISVIVIGVIKNGANIYKLVVPSGMPWVLLIFMIPIELISFFARPLTLSMRLFGNMLGGHVVMNIFGSFVVMMGIAALGGGIAMLGFVGSGLSIAILVALTALELIVAFLQAFVFAALATVYLNEVVNLGHGH